MKNNKIIYVEDPGINRNNIITPGIKPLDTLTITDENKETYYECIYIPISHSLNKRIAQLYRPYFYIHTKTWDHRLYFHGKIKRRTFTSIEYFWYGKEINNKCYSKKRMEIQLFL